MTASQALHRGQHRGRLGFSPVVAALCLVLLALLAVAQVAHLHSGDADSGHCQLCAVLHTVAPAAPPAAAIVLVPLGVSAPQAEPPVVTRQRQSRITIRPPPAAC